MKTSTDALSAHVLRDMTPAVLDSESLLAAARKALDLRHLAEALPDAEAREQTRSAFLYAHDELQALWSRLSTAG